MSEYWILHCATCKKTPEDGDIMWPNHGQSLLRMLVKVSPFVRQAYELDDTGYLEFAITGYPGLAASWPFLWEHMDQGHEIVLMSEYGDTEPVIELKESA